MKDDLLIEQATKIERLLPKLMRKLFTLEPEHPVSEMPLAQLRVCSMLQCGPRTMSVLSEELNISVSAITQIADRLERSGFVERVIEGDDRRMKQLKLTERGAEIMRSRREVRQQRVAKALQEMPFESRQQVIDALKLLLEASKSLANDTVDEDPVLSSRLEQE